MNPVFIDFHIHTSNNPNSPNQDYDVTTLKRKIEEIANGSEFLISLTDHNFVNKTAYLQAINIIDHLLLGVELHVRNFDEARPYHCHIIFKLEITEEVIDDVNEKLDDLFPKKIVGNDDDIPKLEDIINCFDGYDFILMPHGGQNHSTFNKSIPKGKQVDRSLMRSVYYNHFDGFTARSNQLLEQTLNYFKRLGLEGVINLVTATDNYFPEHYPNGKAGRQANAFVPTWMLAEPTYDGLRVSLSESSRLVYGEKPDRWAECIHGVQLKNEHIDIDIKLTPGLNVVIGGSSSGKSLLVDSICRQIKGDFKDSPYLSTPFDVENIQVDNPAGQHPHYLDQNYIVRVCDPKDKESTIDSIEILKNVFPSDKNEAELIQNGLNKLHRQLDLLVEAVEKIEGLQSSLATIPALSHLIVEEQIRANPIKEMLPDHNTVSAIEYSQATYDRHWNTLEEINDFLSRNPIVDHDGTLIEKLQEELNTALFRSELEGTVRSVLKEEESELNETMAEKSREVVLKRKNFERLIVQLKEYARLSRQFSDSLEGIAGSKIEIDTSKVRASGHTLYIDNEFKLTKESVLDVINQTRRQADLLTDFDSIQPETLFKENFRRQNPKITSYDELKNHIKGAFNRMNSKSYRIETSDGKHFDQLSAGWKTSIILDLILGWKNDTAPLIIDQPEDNLATSYINHGLIKAIMKAKTNKQIILVSHNATIPMLGDAQNVVFCKNEDNVITIRANVLEGHIDDKSMIDLIARETDGGKSSIRKRVKKYNLKDFRDEHDEA